MTLTSYTTCPAQSLQGKIEVAADKSLSHRALIFSAIAEGESRIQNLLASEDVLRTLKIINQLGVPTSRAADNFKTGDELIVQGVGLQGLRGTNEVLYCGNSGTTMRLMLGLLSGQKFKSTLTGDASLNQRPMQRVIKPLEQMGAVFKIEEREGQRFIHTGFSDVQTSLKGITYKSPVASAQVKTALLLAGLMAVGKTQVTEPALSRNHSELMLAAMGVDLTTKDFTVTLKSTSHLKPIQIKIPGDISSAAFFIVAGLITKNSDLLIKAVNLNPTRTGIIDVLLKMGAHLTIQNQSVVAGEAVGDVRVASSVLKNGVIAGDIIPRLIDELPIIALAGSVAQGEMQVRDAAELRVKESDRIQTLGCELLKMDVAFQAQPDGFKIQGNSLNPALKVAFNSYGDHRIAMMAAVAGLIMRSACVIDDVACVQTSFPSFFDLLAQITQSA